MSFLRRAACTMAIPLFVACSSTSDEGNAVPQTDSGTVAEVSAEVGVDVGAETGVDAP